MISFALDTIKVVVTMRTIIGGSSAMNLIWTVKTPTSTTAVILTRMVGSTVSVEALFAIQTIIRMIHESRKRHATIKMMLGFE